MEFLEQIGDAFNSLLAFFERFLRGLFGSSNDRVVRQIGFVRDKSGQDAIVSGSALDRTNQLEADYEKLTDTELKEKTAIFRRQLADGKTLDDILPDAFAAARESGKRYLKMRHYNVQLVGGMVLHKGMIAEMATGEGKTLVATLPSYLNALAGSVHVVTVNDYLAKRDMEWMGPLHLGLGLSVGAIQSQMDARERQIAYAADITYGTNNEFGFDYLRDNMKPSKIQQVQGPLNYALVDEIDNILIDEARTPLIISGPAHDDVTRYAKAHRVAIQLKKDEHFEVKEKEYSCHLTEEGVRYAEKLADVDSFYTAGNMEWPHLIDNSLKAIYLKKKDVDYVVENGEIVIVDEHTGRKMYGRQWSDGLHQACEAKEGVRIKETTQTLATITLQNYFKLYKKLAGMTGTAMTEANEFYKIYKLDVVAVPTNRPTQRVNYPDSIFRNQKEKWDAVVNEIKQVHATGRPVLVGTVSIEKSELLSNKLGKFGIPHEVLNAKFHEREAEIVSQAGRKGAVTISTNMAGRGTDIILGGNPEFLAWEELKEQYGTRLDVPKSVWDERTAVIAEREGMKTEGAEVKQVGGLHVVGTERHDSRRIDLQLRGRAGRQGDPGTSRFFLSLEDDMMRIFAGDTVKWLMERLGMQEGDAIESPMVTRQIEKAQKRREEHHFEQRKHLLEYDEVMDEQRKRVYRYRQNILDGDNCRALILTMIDKQIEKTTKEMLSGEYRWESIAAWTANMHGIDVEAADLRGFDRQSCEQHLREQASRQAEDMVNEQIEETLPANGDPAKDWNYLSLSRWVNGRYGLNTNDRELKKIERGDLITHLMERINKSLEKLDFSMLDEFLEENFPKRNLVGWMQQQFTVVVPLSELEGKDSPAVIPLLQKKIREKYIDQEIRFPVAVGMTNFMSDTRGPEYYNRDGMLQWGRARFATTDLDAEDVAGQKAEVEAELIAESARFYRKGEMLALIEAKRKEFELDPDNKDHLSQTQAQQIADWAQANLAVTIPTSELTKGTSHELNQVLLQAFDRKYRPEFSQTERSLILEVLDTAWKEHLLYMDHLRSGIGLVGYAQKDPKVEYKREGMKAFEQMWDRIRNQVTSAIFRIEKESAEFVGSLWRISAATHAVPTEQAGDVPSGTAPAGNAPRRENPRELGAPDVAVDPIVNEQSKVGRNDLCPCGSGKKYKKCHGVGM